MEKKSKFKIYVSMQVGLRDMRLTLFHCLGRLLDFLNGEPFYKLIQGDCLEVLPTLNPQSVDVIVADLPYNVKIASWDNIKNYDEWLLRCFKEFQRVLKPNGSLWFFHMSFPVVSRLNVALEKETAFRFKQFITINKGLQSIAGRCSDALRSYPRATEYLLFYTFADLTGCQQLSDNYARINPMAAYLKVEFKKGKVTFREIAKLFPSKTGGMTGCVSNWVKGLNFPLPEQYKKIKEYLRDSRPNCDLLKREYEDLKREYEANRYTFNMESGVTDVWDYSFYEDGDGSHPTMKPIKLIKRIISTSTKKGDIVLDPTAGSGSTIKACKDLERSCIAIEKSEKHYGKTKKQVISQTNLRYFDDQMFNRNTQTVLASVG